MMKTIFERAIFGLVFAAYSFAASAAVTTYSDRSVFNAQGTIAYNSNFADFGPGFGWPGDPFTRGDVTYTSANNLTVGAGTGYSIGSTQTVMSNNYWTPMTGTIASTTPYNLFGFDLAVTSGPVDISVMTNQNTYSFLGLTISDGAPDFTFEGFQATGTGEYFTGFRIDTISYGYLPGMTNVAVGGNIAAVPEPETSAMLLAGLGLLGFTARRRKNFNA